MKQSKIIDAYNTLETLSDLHLNPTEQWNLYQLRLRLRPHIEFQNERLAALREKYAEFIDEKGMIQGKEAQDYLKEVNELRDLDVEMEEKEKIKIRFVEGITFKITEPLEDFIEFVAPEG